MSADEYLSIFSRQMVTIVYIANGNIANQIHVFPVDYGKFILKGISAALIYLYKHTARIFSVLCQACILLITGFGFFFIHVKFVALNSRYFILQGAILAAVASRKFPSKITVN